MGLRRLLAGLAAGAAVPVFLVVGEGGTEPADWLRLEGRLRVLDSPRTADVLLVVGRLTERLLPAALAVHDQMSRPRTTVQWLPGGPPDPLAGLYPDLLTVRGTADLVSAVVARHRQLLAGVRPSDPPILPDVDPAPWRGIGPYGQGGRGMTGGVPYGRPLARRAPDRDGLELDRLPVRVGPLFPALPPGLVLEVGLQGDVVQEASVAENAFLPPSGVPPDSQDPFVRALEEPVPVAELELARARHHLRWLSRALAVHGLGALALRVLALARRLEPSHQVALCRLERILHRLPTLRWATSGVGRIPGPLREALPPGPVARALGVAADARAADPAYRALGFEPVVLEESDAWARLRQRLAEAGQALALAGAAGSRKAGGRGVVESPVGRATTEASPVTGLLQVVPELLAGQEWGDAVTTLVSLDLDMEEAARPSRVVAALSARPEAAG